MPILILMLKIIIFLSVFLAIAYPSFLLLLCYIIAYPSHLSPPPERRDDALRSPILTLGLLSNLLLTLIILL